MPHQDKDEAGRTVTVMAASEGRFFRNKTRFFLILALVAVFGAGALWIRHVHGDKQVTAPSKQTQIPSHQIVRQSVEADYATGNYDGAIKTLQAQPNRTTQEDLLLAGAYVNKKDYKSALTIYARLNASDALQIDNLQGAAAVAEQAKDYPTAIHYYQEAKAKTLANKASDPTWQSDVAFYDASIKRLQ